jgi:curved DNA-binding protein CbpA
MLMLAHYLTLDLAPGASQEEIRQRYLDLIRSHPPSRDPDRFGRIAAAYEALQDDRARVRTAMFGIAAYSDWELALDALVQARTAARKVPGLQALLAAEGLAQ